MEDVILSLNNGVLKAVTLDKEGLKTASKELDSDSANDSEILDTAKFSVEALELITQLRGNKSVRKLGLVFVSQPQDVILKFITSNKSSGDVDDQIIAEIQQKLEGVNLDELYFSYSKIAPFVYQFIGVKKDYLEKFLEVSNTTGLPLNGVYPFVLFLPKYLNINDPAIFVTKINSEQVVALSELNGIFYTGIFEKGKSEEELEELVKDLSIYKRNSPITKIFTLNYEDFEPDNGFQLFKIDVPGTEEEGASGYDANLLVKYMLDTDPDLKVSTLNLLSLLPLPVEVKKKMPVAAVGMGVALVIAALVFGGMFFLRKDKAQNVSPVADNQNPGDAVLSEASNDTAQSSQPQQEQSPAELNRKDLKIRVENGSNVNGAAAKIRDKLNTLGYTVLSIDTASETTGPTIFRFKKDKVGFKAMLTADLKDAAPNTVVQDTLAADAQYDLLVVLGSSINL